MKRISYALLAIVLIFSACTEESLELGKPDHAGGPKDKGGNDGGSNGEVTSYLTGSSTTDTPADDTTNWEPVQKQADWFETNVDHKGYIKNRPINFGDELRKTDRFNGIEGNVVKF